jgi:hypothetical protein
VRALRPDGRGGAPVTRRPLALGPLRKIVEVLPSPLGYRPARVKLERGHEGISWGRSRDDSGTASTRTAGGVCPPTNTRGYREPGVDGLLHNLEEDERAAGGTMAVSASAQRWPLTTRPARGGG